jgi:uncharacterized protein YegP (UPF0339 family)
MNSRAAQIYDFALAAGETQVILTEGSYYKIASATGAINVRRSNGSMLAGLMPGQGERDQDFNKLTITDASGAPNVGRIIVADRTFVDDRLNLPAGSSIAVSNQVQLATSAFAPAPNNWFDAVGAFVANTPVQVIAPAANVNGVVVLAAAILTGANQAANPSHVSLIAKNAAPASVVDGNTLLIGSNAGYEVQSGVAATSVGGQMSQAVTIAAGLGLYFVCDSAVAYHAMAQLIVL